MRSVYKSKSFQWQGRPLQFQFSNKSLTKLALKLDGRKGDPQHFNPRPKHTHLVGHHSFAGLSSSSRSSTPWYSYPLAELYIFRSL